jgi:uncharacterized protein (TIGR00106 family)
MPLMEISIVPLGTSSPSVSSCVKKIVKVLKDKPDIEYRLTSMGTVIDAESVERLLETAGEMHRAAMNEAVRVNTIIKIDDRSDKILSMQEKIESVCSSGNSSSEVEEWIQKQSVPFLKRLGIRKGQTVIDFGCRSGNYTFAAAEAVTHTGRIYAVDKDRKWLEEIDSAAVKQGISNITALGSISWHTTVDKGSVDGVLLFDVFHPGYFPEQRQRAGLLDKFSSVLRKGGSIYALATHLGMYDMSENDFIEEVESCGFSLTDRKQGKVVHDGSLEHNTVFIFQKEKE